MTLFGITITEASLSDIKQQLSSAIRSNHGQQIVFTSNPEILLYARKHKEFSELLNTVSTLNVPDGSGLVWMSQGKLAERITGTDLMMYLLEEANTEGRTVGFVLNADGLSSKEDVKKAMRQQFSHCNAIITNDTFDEEPEIVFVGLGSPLQEEWCQKQSTALTETNIILTVGGGVDFLTDRQTRSPLFFQRTGLEWLWRLIQQPRRIKRIVNAVIVFPLTVWRDRYER